MPRYAPPHTQMTGQTALLVLPIDGQESSLCWRPTYLWIGASPKIEFLQAKTNCKQRMQLTPFARTAIRAACRDPSITFQPANSWKGTLGRLWITWPMATGQLATNKRTSYIAFLPGVVMASLRTDPKRTSFAGPTFTSVCVMGTRCGGWLNRLRSLRQSRH
jgi:hypothetical protein